MGGRSEGSTGDGSAAESTAVTPPGPGSAMDVLKQEETTARQNLLRERRNALDRQSRLAGWLMLFGVGPAALAALFLAMLTDRPDLIWPFFGLGAGVQIWRIWKEQRRIRKLDRELEDPIDGS